MELIFLILWLGSSIWSYTEAKARAAEGIKIEPFSPAGWLWGVLLLGIIFFPWFLVKRSNNIGSSKPTLTRIVEQVSQPLRQQQNTMPASIADELRKFADLKEQGLITQDEYETQRKKLLGS
jgi:hypothetical protein